MAEPDLAHGHDHQPTGVGRVVARQLRHRQQLAGEPDAVAVPRGHHGEPRAARQDRESLGCVRRDERQRALVRLPRERPVGRRPRAVAEQRVRERGPHGFAPLVQIGQALLGQLHGAGVAARQARRLGRPLQQRVQVQPGQAGRIRRVRPAPQRPLVVRVGLGRRERRARRLTGTHGRHERLGHLARRVPVVGQLGRRGPAGQQPRDPGVGLPALAGQQVGVDRLADQRVPERVGVLAGRDQLSVVDEVSHRGIDVRPGKRCQLVVEHGAADHRRQPGERARALGQPGQPGDHHLADRLRHLAACRPRGHQFFGEERVALRANQQQLHHLAGRLDAEQAAGECRGLRLVEWRQPQPLGVRHAGQLGHHARHRVVAGDLAAAVRADLQHGRVAQRALQEHEQVAGGRVGPVQVLEHQHHRPAGAGNRVGHAAELGGPVGRTRRGEEEPGDRAERLVERRVGDVRLELQTAARQHGGAARRRPVGELLDQPGLADPRVALDQHQAAGPGGDVGQGVVQHGQLASPADEFRHRHPSRHALSIPR